MEYWFYHLEQSTLESTLPSLLEKSIERGWRARVNFANAPDLKAMDDFLWAYRADSFLPHGCDSEPMADQHPILLSQSSDVDSDGPADIVFLVGGAQVEGFAGAQRCVTMVDSRDADGAAIARARWQKAKAADMPVSYWRQDARGRWQKQ